MSDLGNKEVMAENIKRFMEYYGQTAADVCKAIDVKKGAFSTWVNGKAYPRIDKIELMARHFHCTKADLVEKFDESLTVESRITLHNLATKAETVNRTLSTTIQFHNEEDLQYFKKLLVLMHNPDNRKFLAAVIDGLSKD